MITVIATLCLFTAVKTENVGFQVQTVKIGTNVTIQCDQNTDKDNKDQYLAWYKQSLGKVPAYVVRQMGDEKNIRYGSDFVDRRFTVNKAVFDLNINETKEEDAGVYFCGKIKLNNLEFGSGTLLVFQAEKTDDHPLTEIVIKSGDSVTLQCSVQSLSCSGDHSVHWFRHGSGDSHPGILYAHGNRSDQCEKSSETGSPTQSCVYKLPKRNLSLSDAGTYYCAVAACGKILFGNQTKVIVTENNSWIVITLTTLNAISVIVIIVLVGVLLKNQQNDASNNHTSPVIQAEDTDNVNYSVLNFAKKPPPSRTSKVQESQDIYSHVKYS
ncbi:uncharacterized protein [Salminus brasiliensis]|uniref:uncharacterized protein n=1 Tax=Salminus brasiliensis TaxID=930266 RepID=UPI003B839014